MPDFPVLLAFISIVFVYSCVRLCRFTKCHYWKVRGLPFLNPVYPLFGNMPELLWLKTLPEIIEGIYLKTEGMPYIGVYAFHSPVLFVRDLDIAAKILTNDFHHFEDRGFHANEADPFGRNLIHQNGHEWRFFRTQVAAFLSNNRVKRMFPIMKAKSKVLLHVIEANQSERGTVEAHDVCLRFTTDVLTSSSLGIEANTLQDENSCFNRICKQLLGPKFILHVFTGCFYPNVHKMFRIKVAEGKVANFFNSLVKQIIEDRKDGVCEINDIVQKLLQINEDSLILRLHSLGTVNLDSIVGQIFGFFLAGFESTGNILACTLYELAKSQEIQNAVHKEIATVLNSFNNELTVEALHKMKYLHQVLQESLRMYAPLPLIFRRCTKDYTIPGTSTVVEKGTMILFPLRSILRDANYYQNPTKYDPTRFSEDSYKGTMFIPFGLGPRICPAVMYSYIEIKTALVYILRGLEVHISKKTPQYYQPHPWKFLMAPKNGLPLIFRKRQS